MRSSAERSQVLSSGLSTPGQSASSSPDDFLSPPAGLGIAGLEAQNGASNGVKASTAVHHCLREQPAGSGTVPHQVVQRPEVGEAQPSFGPDRLQVRLIADDDGLELPIDSRVGRVFRQFSGRAVPPEADGREQCGNTVKRANHRDFGEPSQEPIEAPQEAHQVDQPYDQQ